MGLFTKEVKKAVDMKLQNIFRDHNEIIAGIVQDKVRTAMEESTSAQVENLKLQKELSQLQSEVRAKKDELASLKSEIKLEKTEMEHLVALKEQRMEVDFEKKTVELEKEYQNKEIALLKDKFSSVQEAIEKQQKKQERVFDTILKALPNVNMEIIKES